MSEKYIIVNLNMFAKNNQVFIVAPNEDIASQGSYTIEELPTVLVELAHNSEIYNIKIAGGTKYSQLVEFGIDLAEVQKYSEKKIKIEVI